jgi:PTH1 family peptidyl-tRNA hydrolase
MNKSGFAVKALMDYYKLEAADVWIIHDDMDLPLGKD